MWFNITWLYITKNIPINEMIYSVLLSEKYCSENSQHHRTENCEYYYFCLRRSATTVFVFPTRPHILNNPLISNVHRGHEIIR